MTEHMRILGENARRAKSELAAAPAELKNRALNAAADALVNASAYILEENAVDVEAARANGMSETMIDRLALNTSRIEGMAQGARQLALADDPVGRVLGGRTLANGLRLVKKAVPLGVIAVIFESRPNVSADAAALCLKAGNAVILRGGKEAIRSNKAIISTMREAVASVGLCPDVISIVEDTTRESARELMTMNSYVDVLIPRGGAGLIRSCVENATVPVIETGTGNCHVYVDASADIDMAVNVIVNAKTSRPSVCNACESLVIHSSIIGEALPKIACELRKKGVELRCDERALAILPDGVAASEEDFGKEFLDLIISVKTVDSVEQAVEHINNYSTGHSEAIITKDLYSSEYFTERVDSAAVYVNASTRFTDGGEFGMGAEIGISTQKLHARGPLGLNELTTFKYIVSGEGQIR